jgi:hypothetical protein
MKRAVPMVLLTVGLGLAAASAARNGASVEAYRQSRWSAEGEPAAVATLPTPSQRVREWLAVGGLGWGAGLALILVGAALARQQSAEAFAGGGAAIKVDFVGSVRRVRAEAESLLGALERVNMGQTAPDVRSRLDALQLQVVEPLVDGRGQLVAKHGAARFAEYFGPFSSGERNLNRCWSALTDGHVVVARAALGAALHDLGEAEAAWDRVVAAER